MREEGGRDREVRKEREVWEVRERGEGGGKVRER